MKGKNKWIAHVPDTIIEAHSKIFWVNLDLDSGPMGPITRTLCQNNPQMGQNDAESELKCNY